MLGELQVKKYSPSASLSFKICHLILLGASSEKTFYPISEYTRLPSGFC